MLARLARTNRRRADAPSPSRVAETPSLKLCVRCPGLARPRSVQNSGKLTVVAPLPRNTVSPEQKSGNTCGVSGRGSGAADPAPSGSGMWCPLCRTPRRGEVLRESMYRKPAPARRPASRCRHRGTPAHPLRLPRSTVSREHTPNDDAMRVPASLEGDGCHGRRRRPGRRPLTTGLMSIH
jgi:hypothetical protein